jgi:hypothetical protein
VVKYGSYYSSLRLAKSWVIIGRECRCGFEDGMWPHRGGRRLDTGDYEADGMLTS